MKRTGQALDQSLNRFSRILSAVGVMILMLLTFIMVAGVITRFFFNFPIPGVLDLVEFMMAAMLALGLAYTAVAKRNIIIDMLLDRFPPRCRKGFVAAASLVSLLFFAAVTWAVALVAYSKYAVNSVSHILYIPHWPFVSIIGLGCFVLTLVLLSDFIKNISGLRRADPE